MGKFDTKREIFGLFLGAAGVAALLILFINAEVKKRSTAETSLNQMDEEPFVRRISSYIRSLYEDQTKHRSKRSVEDNQIDSGDQMEDEISLTESLLSEDKNGHKIRHLENKIRQLGKKSMLVRSVLNVYCVKETYYMTNMVDCTQENVKSDHLVGQEADKELDIHHQPLLEEDVFSDTRVLKSSSMQSKPLHLTCTVQTIVIVFITTLTNIFILLLTLGTIKLVRLVRSTHHPAQDKVWLVEDDLQTLYDEPTEPVLGKISMVA